MASKTALIAAAATALLTAPLPAQQRVELPAKDRPLRLEARTLFQVGAVEGEEWETFESVSDLAFGPDGTLYLLESSAQRVIVFDPAGKFVRFIGRQGGGPGEFGMPTAIAVLPSGELVVNDASKGSLQLFAPDGTFQRTVTVDEELGRAVGRMRSGGKGLVTETIQLRRMMEGGGSMERFQMPPRSVTALTIGEAASGQRLFNTPPRDARMTDVGSSGGAMRVRMSVTAFEPTLLWTALPGGGIAAMNTVDYRVGLVDGNGRPHHYLQRDITPRKVTDADRKRFMERRREGIATVAGGASIVAFRTGGGSGGAPPPPPPSSLRVDASDLKEEDVTWGDVVPVVTALGADSFGRLWIQRSAPDQGDGPIDLVGPKLEYLGTLAPQPMPRAFGPDGRVAYVERDDLDVQRIIVRQFRP